MGFSSCLLFRSLICFSEKQQIPRRKSFLGLQLDMKIATLNLDGSTVFNTNFLASNAVNLRNLSRKATVCTLFCKMCSKRSYKNGAGEGTRTPASQRPTGLLAHFGTGPVCATLDLEASAITTPPPRLE